MTHKRRVHFRGMTVVFLSYHWVLASSIVKLVKSNSCARKYQNHSNLYKRKCLVFFGRKQFNENLKCLNCRYFKQNFVFEKHLNILPDDLSKKFFDFRSFKHKILRVGGKLEIQRDWSRCEFCSIKLVIKKVHI